MPDIRERFSALDRVEIPDLRPDIERRGRAVPSFEARRTPPVARRLLVACVALVLAVASFLLLSEAFRHTKNTVGRPSLAPPLHLAVTKTLTLPESAFGIASDQGSLWLAAYGHVIAVNPSGMRVTANIPVAHLDDQDGIAASAGTAWVTVGSRGKVVAIDEATGRIRATVPIPGNGVPVQVAADGSDVWVASATSGNATLTHVDAATGRVTAQTQMQGSPKIPMVAALGALWVSEGGGLWKIQPDGSATKIPGIAGISALASGDGSLWASANNALLRLDPATGNVEATIPVFGDSLAVDGPLVWAMVARHRPSVIAVDARTNQVAGRLLHVGRSPSWLGAAAGSGFLLDFNRPNLARIGAPTSATPSP